MSRAVIPLAWLDSPAHGRYVGHQAAGETVMGMAVQVVLLVVAIVVAVGGLGAALAVWLSARQRRRRSAAARPSPRPASRGATGSTAITPRRAPPSPTRAPAAAEAVPAPAPGAGADAAPAPAPSREERLAALQALLALGDAKAGQSDSRFADTQPVDIDDPPTVIADRGDRGQPSPLLNLDKLPARRRP